MIKKISSLMAMAVMLGLSVSSCLDSKETKNEITLNYGGDAAFNRVVDHETGETLISINPAYSMLFNTTDEEVEMTMSNIQLANGFSGLAFKLPEMKYKYDPKTAFYTVEATDLTPLNAGGQYVFNNYSMKAIPARIVNGAQMPVYLVNFTINGRYQVSAYPTTPTLIGTTHATRTDAGQSGTYETDNTILQLRINPATLKATMLIADAVFSQDMPTTNFLVKDLPVTLNDRGLTIVTDQDVKYDIYNTNDAKQNGCSVSNLSLAFNLGTGASSASFSVDLSGKNDSFVTFGSYDVTMDLGYLFKLEQ